MSSACAAPLPPVTFVLGGARSGKSAYAERLLEECAPTRVYLATGEAHDAEMQDRIRVHRERRGPGWQTIEEPLAVCEALAGAARPDQPVLLDCLTLWLSNLMAAGRDIDAETARLARTLGELAGPVVLISNEVGLGIVPATPLGRAYRDHAGRLNQAVAAAAQRVEFVVAGVPLRLKDLPAQPQTWLVKDKAP